MKDFTIARFLISCANEHINFTEQSNTTGKDSADKVTALLDYLKPIHSMLTRSGLLQLGEQSAVLQASTYVERRDELRLLVSFDDCKWICDTLWKNFFARPGQENIKEANDLHKALEAVDLSEFGERLHILEESVLYARTAALMVEADLQERQHASNIFSFES